MSSSNSPCAACKLLRRKCTQECVFAPYFPPDQPQKFANVHKVFGASNVAKLLNELSANLREDAVNSLAYEAEARLRDPVYGCVGLISILQHRLKQVQSDLYNAKKELATYIGPQAMMPMLQAQGFIPQQHLGNPSSSSTVLQHGMLPMMGIPTGSSHSGQLVIRDSPHQHQQQHHQQQQIFEAQQLAAAAAVAAREQQEMLRNYEQQQQQQQQELVRFNSGFDASAGTVTPTGFNQMSGAAISPSLALGSFDNPYQIQAQQQPEHHHHHAAHNLQAQLLLHSQQGQTPPQQQPPQTQQQQKSGSEEGRSVGPSC
ncbi:LOB domain-containing protein [Melia azedarach]|uniref:LOB domain-containing protein n=1 Tax=Melia azedarach TaxID=155640 RepID=A0ACC1XU46_MELAZ|nr:LOB domain-containing protein [Melia azedarach]